MVQSLVLQAQQSCSIVVANVNDAECRISSPPGDSGGAQSASNSVAVIVGGTINIGAMLGIVLLIGLMIVTIVITIVIVNHEQAMARLKYEFPSPSLYHYWMCLSERNLKSILIPCMNCMGILWYLKCLNFVG